MSSRYERIKNTISSRIDLEERLVKWIWGVREDDEEADELKEDIREAAFGAKRLCPGCGEYFFAKTEACWECGFDPGEIEYEGGD